MYEMAGCLLILTAICLSGQSAAQIVYVPGQNGPDAVTCAAVRPPHQMPWRSSSRNTSAVTFPTQTTRTATSITSSANSTYGLPYASVTSAFSNLSTTTWGNWVPSTTSGSANLNDTDQYGRAAFTSLWHAANPTNFSRGIYSSTVAPTAVPSAELVYPPPLYFKPATCWSFPDGFIFGAAGSASQSEGAIADEGKSPAFTDMLATLFSIIGSNPVSSSLLSTGEGVIANNYVANEHYYLYKQDIERLASMGLEYYAFSISWARILPFALPGTPVNEEALDHYEDVINFVLAKGMRPVITLTHFDTPLQFYGGGEDWLYQLASDQAISYYGTFSNWGYHNTTFEDAYVNYASIVMSRFADRIPVWFTFNEPHTGTINGAAIDHVIKAHARVYHFYKEELKGTGQVSVKMAFTPAMPFDPQNSSHAEAADYFTDLYFNTFINPLGPGSDYPDALKLTVPDYVPLSATDLAYLRGTIDFVAIDAYAAPIIYPVVSNLTACALDTNATSNPHRSFPTCVYGSSVTRTGWDEGYPSVGQVMFDFPQGLRWQLNYIWHRFGLPIMVSEFGLQPQLPTSGRLQDNRFNVPQSEYLVSYLTEILNAIWEDGINIIGAVVWTWGDEWDYGSFDIGFGLQYINRTTQERMYRRSFFDVIDFVKGSRQHWGV